MQKTTKNAIILFQHECNYIICTIEKTKQVIFIKYRLHVHVYIACTFSIFWIILTLLMFQHSEDK